MPYISFREGQYSGAEFKAALNDSSALSFARIRQYPANASIHSIDEYEDYAESECESLILFYDGGFLNFIPRTSIVSMPFSSLAVKMALIE